MFTGLVETVGTVATVAQSAPDAPRRLVVACALPHADIAIGDSIAINGCCLTVVALSGAGLAFEAAHETLQRTTLGALQPGDRVNMERALRLSDRLGGHLVAGHVDGVGHVAVREMRGSALYLGIDAPAGVGALTAAQGSVTVAGVSLTVTEVVDKPHCRFFVALIPHTLAMTTLDALRVGDAVNLEADLMARYIQRLMAARNLLSEVL